MIAVMAKCGLRVGEVCALRWGRRCSPSAPVIEQAETAAGVREVDPSLDLVDELNRWHAERTYISLMLEAGASLPT